MEIEAINFNDTFYLTCYFLHLGKVRISGEILLG